MISTPQLCVPMIATPQPLVLYTLVDKSRVLQCIDGNTLPLRDWEWHIGLRQQLEEALAREIRFSDHVDKDSHLVLRVTFSPLGVAHFATTFGDKANQFKPMLHKMAYRLGCMALHRQLASVLEFAT